MLVYLSERKRIINPFFLYITCKQSEENQTLAWISKPRQKPNKKLRETQTLGFLRNDCECKGWGEAENQSK
jgi:hypothetical protein